MKVVYDILIRFGDDTFLSDFQEYTISAKTLQEVTPEIHAYVAVEMANNLIRMKQSPGEIVEFGCEGQSLMGVVSEYICKPRKNGNQ